MGALGQKAEGLWAQIEAQAWVAHSAPTSCGSGPRVGGSRDHVGREPPPTQAAPLFALDVVSVWGGWRPHSLLTPTARQALESSSSVLSPGSLSRGRVTVWRPLRGARSRGQSVGSRAPTAHLVCSHKCGAVLGYTPACEPLGVSFLRGHRRTGPPGHPAPSSWHCLICSRLLPRKLPGLRCLPSAQDDPHLAHYPQEVWDPVQPGM